MENATATVGFHPYGNATATVGRPADATRMAARAESQRKLIAAHLWDEEGVAVGESSVI